MPAVAYTFTSSNRATQITDVACGSGRLGISHGLVAMAAHNAVGVYEPHGQGTKSRVRTLKAHTDSVIAVAFIRRQMSNQDATPEEAAIVSASADKTLRVWKPVSRTDAAKKKESTNSEWICSAVLEGHTAPVNALAVMKARRMPSLGGKDLIVSAATDGTARIWERRELDAEKDEVTCVQVIKTGPRYALAAAVGVLPNTDIPILFLGGCDNMISVYIRSDSQFTKMLSLQGHTDWIRNLDVATFTESASVIPGLLDGDLMIASASQDKYVRLWKVSEGGLGAATESAAADRVGGLVSAKGETKVDADISEFNDAIEMLEALVGDEGEGGRQLSTKAHIIEVVVDNIKRKYTVMFDALLIGHEDWVHSIAWAPPIITDGMYHQKLEIVSASADKCVTVWRPDSGHVWSPEVRLGEVGGQNSFGFYGARFGPNSDWILAHGYHGAVQFWGRSMTEGSGETWKPIPGLSGHYASVEDIAWNETGDFLISSSLDQTSRLWGEWRQPGKTEASWHEIARPQIHGYDLHCLAMVHKYGFVSGADEKVIRVFEASKTFLESLENISGIAESQEVYKERPIGASVPALGLSNKAILPGAAIDTNAQLIFEPMAPDVVQGPPLEQYLIQHTLWPEVNKLYGHGYELISIAASHDGKFVASSSKAAVRDHAVIRVWSTSNWKESQIPLSSHSSTVTAIQFSHNDKYILSCGRDRMWSLFEAAEDGTFKLTVSNAAHARIIWGCSWSHDDKYFGTASRDKTVKIWNRELATTNADAALTIKLESSITSVAFSPRFHQQSNGSNVYLVAVGHEDGSIQIVSLRETETGLISTVAEVGDMFHLPVEDCPGAAVKKLAWRPRRGEWVLASASEDHSDFNAEEFQHRDRCRIEQRKGKRNIRATIPRNRDPKFARVTFQRLGGGGGGGLFTDPPLLFAPECEDTEPDRDPEFETTSPFGQDRMGGKSTRNRQRPSISYPSFEFELENPDDPGFAGVGGGRGGAAGAE
ncbi:Elongator subunit elp2 [Chytriomyces hyalinus]|nr:Elongator subunit elp2 [Chytriomyces hyalinus]